MYKYRAALPAILIGTASVSAGCTNNISESQDETFRSEEQELQRHGTPNGLLRALAKRALGKRLFEDENLSASGTQSCASCHQSDKAFTGNNNSEDPLFPVSTGAFPDLFGNRNTPTAKYMAFSPAFSFVDDEGDFIPVGGQFLDGRASTLQEQATQPFLNPREMAMPDAASVVERVKDSSYSRLFRLVYGRNAFKDAERAFQNIADAIATFEMTALFSPFNSKFDWVLRGYAKLSKKEQRGFELFKDPEKGNCIGCHVGDDESKDPNDWLFTDFTYDNLGVPRNDLILDNADPDFYDLGVCRHPGILDKIPEQADDAEELVEGLCGAFKVPTLRNVALTAPYMHNGKFETLEEVVSFYVTRDTDPERWYPVDEDGNVNKFDDLPSKYHANVNTGEPPYDRLPGQEPRLNEKEISDVVAFLKTLTDGYSPKD